jgi:hypothetical protein
MALHFISIFFLLIHDEKLFVTGKYTFADGVISSFHSEAQA